MDPILFTIEKRREGSCRMKKLTCWKTKGTFHVRNWLTIAKTRAAGRLVTDVTHEWVPHSSSFFFSFFSVSFWPLWLSTPGNPNIYV